MLADPQPPTGLSGYAGSCGLGNVEWMKYGRLTAGARIRWAMKRRNPMDPSAAAAVADASLALRTRNVALAKLLARAGNAGDAQVIARQNVSDAHRVLERAIRTRDAPTREGP